MSRTASAIGTIFLILAASQSTSAQSGATSKSPPTGATAQKQVTQVEPPKTTDPAVALFESFNKKLQAVFKKSRESNHLWQINGYRALVDEFGGKDKDIDEILSSFMSWKLSAVGRYREAHQAIDQVAANLELPTPEELSLQRESATALKAEDAITAIVKAAAKRQAVFINEGHHVPQHRALMLRLLPDLREIGFTHFAAETLAAKLEGLKERGYPDGKTGIYTDEPLYADIVRTALALGFEIVPYEAVGPARKEREVSQARNLKERIFDKTPEARVVVFLGYSHNRESPDAFRGQGAMAHHFRSMTGINPLTIGQTDLTEHSVPTAEHPLYEQLCGNFKSTAAVVFKTPSGVLWSLPERQRDITICHPRTQLENGRPTWLALGGHRKAVPQQQDICADVPSCLIEARPQNEGQDAIPIDRLLVRSGEPIPALMLPIGSYQIEASTADGSKIRSWDLAVSP